MNSHAPHHEHKADAPKSIGCMVITCSDTRTTETDTSGFRIMNMLKGAGHEVVAYHLIKDEPSKIKAKIKTAVANKKIQAIIINGGTRISRRDSTFEAGGGQLEKRRGGVSEGCCHFTHHKHWPPP